jgi:Ca-activated chloride channel homolog
VGVVVLVSDGEALEESRTVRDAAVRAARAGITDPRGRGRDSGRARPSPRQTRATAVESYKRGPDGEIVITALNEELLREVASATGGRYVRLGEAGATDARADRRLRGLERTEGDSQRRVRQKERYAWFVLLALVLLLMTGWWPATGGPE